MRFRFTGEVFEWSARANWFFVALPEDQGVQIAEVPLMPRGFGAVKVNAHVGSQHWSTSIFPSDGTYVLPLKRAVMTAEALEPGAPVTVDLEVLVNDVPGGVKWTR